MMDNTHPLSIYMQRCVDLALKAGAHTKSNPLVGAVIVYNDQIIGEGYHAYFGGPHAEIVALESISASDQQFISQATLFISLEPCNHFGKTPPCTQRIIAEGIKKVVIGCVDPNPIVSGAGIQVLKDHGIEVICPVLEKECKGLISKFVANMHRYPYVI
jgi:diaminohydroxyphosphoribosylaminopyrimidine deaminase / 5-amino-6-(5-phosphoribosylamino)uracil reductase